MASKNDASQSPTTAANQARNKPVADRDVRIQSVECTSAENIATTSTNLGVKPSHTSVTDETIDHWVKKCPFLIRVVEDGTDVFYCKTCMTHNKKNQLVLGQRDNFQENTRNRYMHTVDHKNATEDQLGKASFQKTRSAASIKNKEKGIIALVKIKKFITDFSITNSTLSPLVKLCISLGYPDLQPLQVSNH